MYDTSTIDHWLNRRRQREVTDPETGFEAERYYRKEDRIQLYARLFLLLCVGGFTLCVFLIGS